MSGNPGWKYRLDATQKQPLFQGQVRDVLTRENRAIADSEPTTRQDPSGRRRASVEGGLVTESSIEAGQQLYRGNNVCVESDGLLYRSRAKTFGTQNTAGEAETTHSESMSNSNPNKSISVSDTVKLYAFVTGVSVRLLRIVVDPDSSAIVSQTGYLIKGGTQGRFVDMTLIDDNKVVITYGLVSTSTVFAKVLSGLDTTVTQGSELS
ncbi:hypothetical protein KDA23_07765, partial [Candidatus Saccharibacteria bacterium]|nr:hypothetical protein [Candidatus Saccharibacteria bacterium]